MKILIDVELCQGHARCWDLCPEVFDLDDGGHAVVIRPEVPDHLRDRALEAIANCPEQAISVAD